MDKRQFYTGISILIPLVITFSFGLEARGGVYPNAGGNREGDITSSGQITHRAPVQAHVCKVQRADGSMRFLLPDCWYQKVAALKVVTFKKNMKFAYELSLEPAAVSIQLDEIKAQGIQAIEIFAPAEGLAAYFGLDTKNHYRIDPELGTMDDFRSVVRVAHLKGIAVVVFLNLGYFSVEAPDWIEACKDKKTGQTSGKVTWFLWSDNADAPPPPTQEDIYNTQEKIDEAKAYWGWKYSDLAGSCFWARWRAMGKDGNVIPLPQTNWGSEEWREEAERIVRFWMDTGIDGMLVDAPLCYPYQTWAHNRKHITAVISSYGNVLMDPEGGRDPAWITEAGYNCIHDYGLRYEPQTNHWQDNVIMQAIITGNPRDIERQLWSYHDQMWKAGAVLYARELHFREEPSKRHLQLAVLAGIGDIIVYSTWEGNPDAEETRVLQIKSLHPALHPMASRRKLKTNADDKYYAFLKISQDGSERLLAVYNFQPSPQMIEVDLSVVDTAGLVDLTNGELKPRTDLFKPVVVDLPAQGYRFFNVLPHGNDW